jgi:hypothetical protein
MAEQQGGAARALSSRTLTSYLHETPPAGRISTTNRFAFLDEATKMEIRRKTLKAVAIPGYQVPFGSRELPIARGWGTGGIQLTLALIGPQDIVKVIDQGCDDSVNAVNIRKFIQQVCGVEVTEKTAEATLIQTRHRVPEEPMGKDQILVLQVPIPEPLRDVEPSEQETRRMHGEADYSSIWLRLYEDIVAYNEITIGGPLSGARQPAPYHGPKPDSPLGRAAFAPVGNPLSFWRRPGKSEFTRSLRTPRCTRWNLPTTGFGWSGSARAVCSAAPPTPISMRLSKVPPHSGSTPARIPPIAGVARKNKTRWWRHERTGTGHCQSGKILRAGV